MYLLCLIIYIIMFYILFQNVFIFLKYTNRTNQIVTIIVCNNLRNGNQLIHIFALYN